MRFETMLSIVGAEPVFETGLLLAGDVRPSQVRRQLSRWVTAGKVLKLRRGLYALAPPYRKTVPHPFVVANRMVPASCVSLHSALSFHGLIPDVVQRTTSVTTGRPGRRETGLGRFVYRHVGTRLWFGCRIVDLPAGQRAVVASAEKALLDLIHLEPSADDPAYLSALRLQDLAVLSEPALLDAAARFDRPKIRRAVAHLLAQRREELQERG